MNSWESCSHSISGEKQYMTSSMILPNGLLSEVIEAAFLVADQHHTTA
jgi:hypothetical protein